MYTRLRSFDSPPVHKHTWETFSRNWHVDVEQVFSWTREALLRPLAPGSTVIASASGATIAGSPLSGGYAGAEAAIRFIASCAATESERADLGMTFAALLPQLTPATDLERFGPAPCLDQVGKAVLDLACDPSLDDTAYLLTTAGLATAA